MKNLKQIVFASLSILSLGVFAQKQIMVTETPRANSKDTLQLSFAVLIPQTTLKDISNSWLKYVASGSKGKAVRRNGDDLQTAVVNKNISANPFDVYSKLLETTEGVRLTLWFPENNSVLISKDPTSGANLAVQKYMRDFAVQEYRKAVQKELKAGQNKQKKLESELAVLIKSEEKSVKTVSENERTTERANDAIATNKSDIENSSNKIDNQKGNVESNATDANAMKGAKKTLGEMEDDKKDLQKENEKENKRIDSRNKENREEVRNMVDSQENQEAKTLAIEKQKAVVAEIQAKLDNIK